MSQNPTMDEHDDEMDPDPGFDDDERNKEDVPSKGHGPLKGTDTPATTYSEDLDKARRTTM